MVQKDSTARASSYNHNEKKSIAVSKLFKIHRTQYKDQLAESGRQKTKENISPRGKFRLVENGPDGRPEDPLLRL